ncbi:MAG: BACON domain-containing protein, partial [Bacteroidales bacterium]
DDAIGGGADQLWIYELAVNWTTPASSTFSRVQQLAVSAFDSNFGNDWTNIAQPGTTQQLDAIPQVIMNIPQYRNFGTYQTLVCCHSVDVDNTDHAGVRWYELRRGTQTSGNWSIRQQGTYAPDANSRWMGSISLNGSGKIGLGYSISSSTVYPGIRYTGQSGAAYSAGTGVLDIPETVIQTGAYSQTGAERWGDYSAISIDPLDDQTFWFTTEYIGSGGARKSKIASFKLANDPTVTTLAATAITSTTATLNGNVNPNGLSTTYYFQYGTTISYGTNTTSVSAGSGSGSLAVSASITGLIPGTTYHFRLVATNSDGTSNGSDLLLIPGAATLSTTAVSSVGMNSVASGGSVILDGGSTVTARGVCWNTSINPVVTGLHTTDGAGLGTFTSSIAGLLANTTYHVRAYATNSNGTFYGEDLTFNTLCGIFTLPFTESFTNTSIPNCWTQSDNQGNGQIWQFGTITGYTSLPALTGNYAYLNSDAYGVGNSQNADLITPTLDLSAYATVNLAFKHYFRYYSPSSAKVYYSTNNGSTWTLISTYSATSSPNPTAISQAVNAVAGSSAVRFKWNYTGTYAYYWGIDDINITGTISLPTLTTTAASAIAATTSTSGGNVTAAGSSTVTARGVCWATTANPIATGSHTTDGSGTGVFTSAITGLNSATLYHVRAYATNTSGTSYGSELQFTTLASLPVVSTTTPNAITTTTAASGGNVSGDGGATVIARGVCWSSTLNPTIAGSHTTDGSGLGVFTSAITSLIPNTLYHVRAYATNSIGTAYGNDLQFTTAAAPTLSVTPSNQNVSSVAGNTTFTVTSNTSWTVVSDAVWCSVQASGTGNGPIAAIYTVNTSVISRTAYITVTVTGLAPVVVTLTQSGDTPTLTVTPPIQNATSQAGTTSFTVLSNTNWNVVSDAVWCNATPSGSGNGTIAADYPENTDYLSRTAHLTVSVSGIPSVVVALQQSGADTLLTVTLFPEGLFNGTGLNKAHNGSGEQFAGNIADQITIEVHSSVSPYNLVSPALLADLNTLGLATVVIPASLNGLYYIVVKHRNSIETWSETPVLFGIGSVAYNFTDLQTRAFGSTLKPSSGKFVFPTGDVNQDGVMDALDLIAIDNLAAGFEAGYVPEDLNGDGVVNALDVLVLINNITGFVTSIKP